MLFPDNVDGAVLRRMREHGFDFSRPSTVDFNIDFDHWPLSDEEMVSIRSAYPDAIAIDPDDEDLEEGNTIGYVQFQIHALVTYDLVINTQAEATEIARNIGG